MWTARMCWSSLRPEVCHPIAPCLLPACLPASLSSLVVFCCFSCPQYLVLALMSNHCYEYADAKDFMESIYELADAYRR